MRYSILKTGGYSNETNKMDGLAIFRDHPIFYTGYGSYNFRATWFYMYGDAVCAVSKNGKEAMVYHLLSTCGTFYEGAFEAVAWYETTELAVHGKDETIGRELFLYQPRLCDHVYCDGGTWASRTDGFYTIFDRLSGSDSAPAAS